MKQTMIQAVIFDMDGLLIDSEPFWQEVESEVLSKVTQTTITKQTTTQTMGMRIDEVVEYWYTKYPWETPTRKNIEADIVHGIIEKVKEKGHAMPGVYTLLKQLQEKHIPMAIASSSYNEIIQAVVEKLNLQEYLDIIHSAQHEPYGKPHPGVYITTAEMLKVSPQACLVFEDSPNGVLAAKSAQMKCFAVPSEFVKDDKRFVIADKILNSLEDFSITDII